MKSGEVKFKDLKRMIRGKFIEMALIGAFALPLIGIKQELNQCKGNTKQGGRCKLKTKHSSKKCFHHR